MHFCVFAFWWTRCFFFPTCLAVRTTLLDFNILIEYFLHSFSLQNLMLLNIEFQIHLISFESNWVCLRIQMSTLRDLLLLFHMQLKCLLRCFEFLIFSFFKEIGHFLTSICFEWEGFGMCWCYFIEWFEGKVSRKEIEVHCHFPSKVRSLFAYLYSRTGLCLFFSSS